MTVGGGVDERDGGCGVDERDGGGGVDERDGGGVELMSVTVGWS